VSETKLEQAVGRDIWGLGEELSAHAKECNIAEINELADKIAPKLTSEAMDSMFSLAAEELEKKALARYNDNAQWAIRGLICDQRTSAEGQAYQVLLKQKIKDHMRADFSQEEIARFPLDEFLERLNNYIDDSILQIVSEWQERTANPLKHWELYQKHERDNHDKTYRYPVVAYLAYAGRNEWPKPEILWGWFEGKEKEVSESTLVYYKWGLKSLFEAHGLRFPMKIGAYPVSDEDPTLSEAEMMRLIRETWRHHQKTNTPSSAREVLVLAIATICKPRLNEIETLIKEYDQCRYGGCHRRECPRRRVNIEDGWVCVPTSKLRGRKPVRHDHPQPIPKGLDLLFATKPKPLSEKGLLFILDRMAKRASVQFPPGHKYHSLRHTGIVMLEEAGVQPMELHRHVRWSPKSGQFKFGMPFTYTKGRRARREPRTDEDIQSVDPLVRYWQSLVNPVEKPNVDYYTIFYECHEQA